VEVSGYVTGELGRSRTQRIRRREMGLRLSCRQNVLLCSIVVTVGAGCPALGFSEDQHAGTAIEKQVSQLGELWTTGKRSDYYRKVHRVTKDVLADCRKRSVNKIAAELFESILSKDFKVDELSSDDLGRIDICDLSAMKDLASYLVFNGDVSINERQLNAQLLSRYLGRIRRELVPDYQWKRVTSNVAPPDDVPGFKFSGMAPEAIDDPVGRAKYKAAIRENDENALANVRQRELKSANITMTRPIMTYLIRTFQAEGTSPDLVAECIKNAKLTDKEKREVLSGGGRDER
jgi:hypothetical protein